MSLKTREPTLRSDVDGLVCTLCDGGCMYLIRPPEEWNERMEENQRRTEYFLWCDRCGSTWELSHRGHFEKPKGEE